MKRVLLVTLVLGAALSVALGQSGVGIHALVPRTATLEELFFQMTEGGHETAPTNGRVAEEVFS